MNQILAILGILSVLPVVFAYFDPSPHAGPVHWELKPGWNMISNDRYEFTYKIFSTYSNCEGKIGPLWRYSNGWVTDSEFRPGVGYYIQAYDSCTVTINATRDDPPVISLSQGWNLITAIGEYENLIDSCRGVASVPTWSPNPDDINAWQTVDVLEARKSYWIYAYEPCQMKYRYESFISIVP